MNLSERGGSLGMFFLQEEYDCDFRLLEQKNKTSANIRLREGKIFGQGEEFFRGEKGDLLLRKKGPKSFFLGKGRSVNARPTELW